MSYTLELLRMESQRDLLRRQNAADSAAAAAAAATATTAGDQPLNLSKRAAAVAAATNWPNCLEAKKAVAATAPSPSGAHAAHSHCAKGLSHHHSYFKCCVNIHVSRLLEHWLDWDCDLADKHPHHHQLPPKKRDSYSQSISSSSNSSEEDSSSNEEDDDVESEDVTAKSLILLSPPPSPPSASPPLPNTQRQRRTACNGVSAAADLSKLTLSDILENQLSAGADGEPGGATHMDDGEARPASDSQEHGVQSWLRQIFCARGCDDLEGEVDFLSSFLNYLLKGLDGAHVSGNALIPLLEMVLERYHQLRRLHGMRRDAGYAPKTDLPRLEADVLPQLHHMLRRGLYAEAEAVAAVLLRSDADAVNAADAATGRTLLTHAVEHADRAADLTRLLINYGARVCPGREVAADSGERDLVAALGRERESSAFTWFLRGAMARCALADSGGDLSDAEATLALLGAAMGEQPERMRRHVTRIMLALGRGAALNGALFLQLRLRLSRWWRQPQPLRHQSARRVRRALGPKRLADDRAVAKLELPEKLRKMVRMEQQRPSPCKK